MRGLNTLRVYDASQAFAAAVGRFLRSSAVPENDAEQLRRSAKSIGDNIAEGHGYGVGKNRLRVYRLARGSAQESLNQLRGLLDDELLPRKEFYALFNLGRTIVKMLGEQIDD
jgi:four helix bundle protein